MLKKIIKKITGFDAVEAELKELSSQATAELKGIQEELSIAAESLREAKEKAQELEELQRVAKLSEKERATEKGEPYIAVLDTHVNTENMRNGFFELDWNRHFIDLLIQQGYGSEGDVEEAIVDRWFRVMCADVANDVGVDMSNRGAGFINVVPLSKNQSEVS